jgi:protein arginine N-methyltransferase 1
MLACRAGAQRVYAMDDAAIIGVARKITEANNFEDRITFLKGLSTRLGIAEKVDVVVADQIGRFGFDAGLLLFYRDARERFLKAGGRMLPKLISLQVAPVESQELWEQIEFWNCSPVEFDFRPLRALAGNTAYVTKFSPQEILGTPSEGLTLEPGIAGDGPHQLIASLTIERAGSLHGIGGWFVAQLSEHVSMTNSPLSAQRIDRSNVYFPIDRPIKVAKGDRVEVRMTIFADQVMVAWMVEVWEAGANGQRAEASGLKGRFKHSTFEGMLLCDEDLRRTRPASVPKLTAWGRARASILELCDGQNSLASVEEEVFRRHRDLFRTPAEAANFVADVMMRDGQ